MAAKCERRVNREGEGDSSGFIATCCEGLEHAHRSPSERDQLNHECDIVGNGQKRDNTTEFNSMQDSHVTLIVRERSNEGQL